MSDLSRRNFIKSLAAGAAAGTFPGIISAAGSTPRVVVIGGGFAGATAAKYLKKWSPSLSVTLIEPNAVYYSPILSNLVVTANLSLDRISFNYNDLKQKYGINVVHQYVDGIDATGHTVQLADGSKLGYDRLVVAPGIDFDTVPGLDFTKVPHAWKAGEQTLLLQKQLAAMPNNGSFVMTIPKAPYRCPPGPYERACVVADYLRVNKPGSKVIVLDANADITVEKETFSHAFNVTYSGIVEYHTNVTLQEVDSDARRAITSAGNFDADVLNVIPTQKAGKIVHSSGLVNDPTNRWAGVDPRSYESTTVKDVHIIGDSQGTGQPKAGHIGNGEAKVCADAIIRLLGGDQPYPAPMTNSACYSPIRSATTREASWLHAVFAYDAASGKMKMVPGSLGAGGPTEKNYRRMFDWTDNLFGDTFA